MNLLTILQSNKHKLKILNLREAEDSIQKKLKENLPCYTVAGTFKKRCDEGLIKLSGLAAVDLDNAENYNAVHLMNELKKIDCIAYAGLSCRGKRLFCIVPFLNPEKYVKHYERLIQSFNDMGLPMGDDCHKSISQARFISWNDDNSQFFNHDAKPYSLLPEEKTFHIFSKKQKSNFTKTNVGTVNPFEWCVEQINKRHSFTQGSRHNYIKRLARYCNMKGISKPETLNGCLKFIQSDFLEKEITEIVKHIFTKQTDSHNKYPFKEKIKF